MPPVAVLLQLPISIKHNVYLLEPHLMLSLSSPRPVILLHVLDHLETIALLGRDVIMEMAGQGRFFGTETLASNVEPPA